MALGKLIKYWFLPVPLSETRQLRASIFSWVFFLTRETDHVRICRCWPGQGERLQLVAKLKWNTRSGYSYRSSRMTHDWNFFSQHLMFWKSCENFYSESPKAWLLFWSFSWSWARMKHLGTWQLQLPCGFISVGEISQGSGRWSHQKSTSVAQQEAPFIYKHDTWIAILHMRMWLTKEITIPFPLNVYEDWLFTATKIVHCSRSSSPIFNCSENKQNKLSVQLLQASLVYL